MSWSTGDRDHALGKTIDGRRLHERTWCCSEMPRITMSRASSASIVHSSRHRQSVPQLSPSVKHAGFNRARGASHDLANLLTGVTGVIHQFKRGPLLEKQPQQRSSTTGHGSTND